MAVHARGPAGDFPFKMELEGDVLMITSGNNALKNECPTVGTDESYDSYESY